MAIQDTQEQSQDEQQQNAAPDLQQEGTVENKAPEIPNVTAAVAQVPEALASAPAPAATPAPTAAPQVVQQPVVQPTVKPVNTQPTIQGNNLPAVTAAIEANGTNFQKNLLAVLKAYVEEMAPGQRHLPDDGVSKQYTLWVTIRNVINNAPVEEFKALWTLVLAFFLEYRDKAFHEQYIFRFAEHWRWAKQELDGFQRIINLIKLTADPKNRSVGLKQVDINRALVLPITDDGRQRLLNFYR